MALPTAPELLPTDLKEGGGDHPKVHNDTNTALNAIRNAMITAGFMVAAVTGSPSTPAPTNPSHITTYVAPPRSQAIPTNVVWENTMLQLTDSMAVNGVITVTGRNIKTTSTHCIETNCSYPVVIDKCILITDYGDCVRGNGGASVTVTNTYGYHVTGSQSSRAPGRFVNCYQPRHLRIEHCQFQNSRGILVDRWGGGNGQDGQTIIVRYNHATNITGSSVEYKNSNGASGNYEHSQFIQITNFRIAGIEVAYNRVINFVEESRVEDNLNVYNAGGTAASPAKFHHNFIWGAYPARITDTYFSGTGSTTDGDTDDATQTAQYNEFTYNWFIGCCNAGYNTATGHNNKANNNVIIGSGYAMLNGTVQQVLANYAGICIYNSADRSAAVFHDNEALNNDLGYNRTKDVFRRNDQNDDLKADGSRVNYMPTNGAGNRHRTGPITYEMECQEWVVWQNWCIDNKITVGPLAA